MKKTIFFILLSSIFLIPLIFYYSVPKAQYKCSGNDFAYLDFKLFRNNKFSIIGYHYDFETGEQTNSFFYRGKYKEWENVYDLKFEVLNHQRIQNIFNHTTAGGFVKNSDTYRINKETIDGLNLVYIEGCLIEPK